MPSYLLDTHTLLWYFEQSDQLSTQAFKLITNMDRSIFVSIVSYWEMTIKAGLAKLELPDEIERMIRHAEEARIHTLQIRAERLTALYSLPLHHRDPFDRLIIAQAKVEGMHIISKDAALHAYQVPVAW
jgi:PIN domain nuclease of toxin-antitoxin system